MFTNTDSFENQTDSNSNYLDNQNAKLKFVLQIQYIFSTEIFNLEFEKENCTFLTFFDKQTKLLKSENAIPLKRCFLYNRKYLLVCTTYEKAMN